MDQTWLVSGHSSEEKASHPGQEQLLCDGQWTGPMADNRQLDIEGNNIEWQLNSSLSHYYWTDQDVIKGQVRDIFQ